MMLRVFYILMCSLLVAATSCGQSAKKDSVASVPVPNDLPAIQATTLAGTQVSLKEVTGKVVLVVFRPECDHCQREAQQIEKSLKSFPGYTFYFLSGDPVEQLREFATSYKLDQHANVHVASISMDDIVKHYSTVELPTLYLYSAEGKLIQEFNGEVDISVVIKYL